MIRIDRRPFLSCSLFPRSTFFKKKHFLTLGPARRPRQPAARSGPPSSLGGAAPKGEIRLLGDAARGAVWWKRRRRRRRGRRGRICGSGEFSSFFLSFFLFLFALFLSPPGRKNLHSLSTPPPTHKNNRAPSTNPKRQRKSPLPLYPSQRASAGATLTSLWIPRSRTFLICCTKTMSRTTKKHSGSATLRNS